MGDTGVELYYASIVSGFEKFMSELIFKNMLYVHNVLSWQILQLGQSLC